MKFDDSQESVEDAESGNVKQYQLKINPGPSEMCDESFKSSVHFRMNSPLSKPVELFVGSPYESTQGEGFSLPYGERNFVKTKSVQSSVVIE